MHSYKEINLIYTPQKKSETDYVPPGEQNQEVGVKDCSIMTEKTSWIDRW